MRRFLPPIVDTLDTLMHYMIWKTYWKGEGIYKLAPFPVKRDPYSNGE